MAGFFFFFKKRAIFTKHQNFIQIRSHTLNMDIVRDKWCKRRRSEEEVDVEGSVSWKSKTRRK